MTSSSQFDYYRSMYRSYSYTVESESVRNITLDNSQYYVVSSCSSYIVLVYSASHAAGTLFLFTLCHMQLVHCSRLLCITCSWYFVLVYASLCSAGTLFLFTLHHMQLVQCFCYTCSWYIVLLFHVSTVACS